MTARRIIALALFGLAMVPWFFQSDIIELIVRQRAVLFGRWSEGHFAALLVLTLLAVFLAWMIWPSRPLREQLIRGFLVLFSITVTIFTFFYVSHWFAAPRYHESRVTITNERGIPLEGVVRHRPPNRIYELEWTDAPPRARSYPDAPPGYGTLSITLTSDNNGFRNRNLLPKYDMVLVGDSFAVGSNVSDEDIASEQLASISGRTIYNLGVSGGDPGTYYVNFASFVDRLTPRLAVFMIYEGNDFKEHVALREESATWHRFDTLPILRAMAAVGKPSLGERIGNMFVSSPATRGLERLSQEVFERIGADRPVPGYRETVGWMPLEVNVDGRRHHYSFEPRRLAYLDIGREQFESSLAWRETRDTLDRISSYARAREIEVLFVYVPSKPHVVLPLAREAIPAGQLLNFARYAGADTDDADAFKTRVFANLDSQQRVFLSHCAARGWQCLSLTESLRSASAAGVQTYFTYDQHWTPEGNRVAADTIARWLDRHAADIAAE